MRKKRALLTLSLIVTLLAACAPESSVTDSPAPVTEVLATETLAATLEPETQTAPPEEATALPVATSRGPDLHATDPTTVSLASGGLQFVEFFRFT
jgi:hypothetical protein